MNYYDALQINDGPMKGKWHFVCQNRRQGTHPVGYCGRYRNCPNGCQPHYPSGEVSPNPDCEICSDTGVFKISDEEWHAHAHDTADEARECFRRYLLDDISEENYGDWTGCEVCDTPTKRGLTTRRPWGTDHALCDEHRTNEQLESLTGPMGQMISSY